MGSKLVMGDVGGPVSGKLVSNIELWRVDWGELGTEEANSDGGLEKPAQLCAAMLMAEGGSLADDESRGGALGAWFRRHWPAAAGVEGWESVGGENTPGVRPCRFFFCLRTSCLGVT